MRWRMLPFSVMSAAENMAVDEAISLTVSQGSSPPTMRLYGWEPSAVSIGCFQKVEDEVDLEECERRGVDLVRRRTGGGAVFHERDGEVTYSVIAPLTIIGEDIPSSYREVCGWVIAGLRELGMEAGFRPINDIIVHGRKISGNAQTRREGVFLQHGTVLHTVDPAVMFSVLKVDRSKLADKGIAGPMSVVTSVLELTGRSRDELVAALLHSFSQSKEVESSDLTAKEREMAKTLARDRYQNDEWTFSR